MVTLYPPDPHAPRIFLDSSVIMAGTISEIGASYAILVLAEIGLLRPIVCPYVFGEVERNLLRKAPEEFATYQTTKRKINWEVVPDPQDEAIKQWLSLVPPKDAPVLAAAIAAAPLRFVTLDTKHFLQPQVTQQTTLKITSPGDLLRDVRAAIARGFS